MVAHKAAPVYTVAAVKTGASLRPFPDSGPLRSFSYPVLLPYPPPLFSGSLTTSVKCVCVSRPTRSVGRTNWW